MLTQILPLDMTVADRWFYFPMIGLLGILAIALQLLTISDRNLKGLGYVTAFILIIVLGARTIVRNTDWHDAITFYIHDSTIRDNFDIENALGNEYMSIQEYDKALTHFKKSANLFPYEMNLFNIGSVYEKIGDRQKAIGYYSDALKKDHYVLIPHKHISLTYERLGYMLLLNKNFEETKKQVLIGLNDYPDNVNLWILLAVSDYKLQQQQEALFAAEKAKAIFPTDQTISLYTKILNNQPVEIPKR